MYNNTESYLVDCNNKQNVLLKALSQMTQFAVKM